MIANALITALAILLTLGFWLMSELRFLAPYRHILMNQCGRVLLFWSAVLFVNVFAGVYAMQRKFFLKHTGQKLSLIDRQAASGDSPVPSPKTQNEGE